MRLNRIGRRLVCLLLLCTICAGLLPLTVQAQTKKVRVGIYEKENYHTIDAKGVHSGYDHEYLNKIAYYTGWEYEFVTATWEDCVNMLYAGEIDLLGGLERTQEREEKVIFPTVSTMSAINCMLQDRKSGRYAFEDFGSYNGMRIGVLKGSNQVNTLKMLAQEKGFSYELFLLASETEMQEAMQSGQVDCIYLDSVRDLRQYSILCYYHYTPLYYGVNIRRPDLARELESALETIRIQEPGFEFNLYSKYFEYAQNVSLTRAEREYVQSRGPVKVALNMEVSDLLCRYDNKQDRYVGLVPDTLKLLSERTGLEFEYVTIPSDYLPNTYLQENPDVILAPAMITSLISHDRGFILLKPIYKGRMATVSRKDKTFRIDDAFTLAVPARLYRQQDQIARIFPNAKLIACTTHRSGIELVASGKADVALANEFAASYELQSPFFENLYASNLGGITEDITVGLSYEADRRLVSIMNKGIQSLDERDIRELVLEDTAAISHEISLKEFLYNRRYTVILLAVIVVCGLFFLEERRRYLDNRTKLMAAQDRLQADLEYQEIMFHQANFDELTGLYNQKYFIEKANEWMGANPDTVFRFLWINLKGFRMFNDLYGVEAGDAILRDMAECMRMCIGERGIYGRMYADRFAVCIPRECEINFMDKCIRQISYGGRKLRIHVDIGVYEDTQGIRDANRCMNYALIALQNHNDGDNNPISYFDAAQLEAMRTRQRITNDMERALQEEQFQVYLQPQYDIEGKKLVGAEALSRWIHPELGFIPPSVYIPIFENNHFIHRLSAYICDHVCAMLSQCLAEGKAVPVSVNLSQLDLNNPQLIPMLMGTLEKYQVPIQYLRLEITESAYADNQQQAIQIIRKLCSLGFRMEMDDFGSGYSSLNMLKDVPVDTIKLDMRFLSNGTDFGRAGLIIDFMVQMAHSLDMSVIAEGVETQQDAAFLEEIGCHYVQGYLFGRPMPEAEFTKCLAQSTISPKK